MSRGVWVVRDGELIERHLAPPLHPRFAEGPMVIGDTMDRTMNPANGQYYDSKRAYEKAVKAAGCEIIGNETPKLTRWEPDDPGEDIKAAIEFAESRAPTKAKRKRRGKHG